MYDVVHVKVKLTTWKRTFKFEFEKRFEFEVLMGEGKEAIEFESEFEFEFEFSVFELGKVLEKTGEDVVVLGSIIELLLLI